MTVWATIDQRAKPPALKPQAHVAKHRSQVGVHERRKSDVQRVTSAALIVCGAGGAGAVAGILFQVAQAVSAGVWVVLVASTGAVLVDKLFGRQVTSVEVAPDGSANPDTGNRETGVVEEVGGLPDRTVEDETVRPVDARSGGADVRRAPAFPSGDAARSGPRMVLDAVGTPVRRLRGSGVHPLTRQRFSVVRNGMAVGARRLSERGAPALSIAQQVRKHVETII